MLPVDFPERNFVFTKPEGMTDEQCSDLPVWKGPTAHDEHGAIFPAIISCWKLSKEDLEAISEKGVIWVSVSGTGMPPISLFTEYPFVPLEKLGQ